MAFKKVGSAGDLAGMLLSGAEPGTKVEGVYKGYKMVPGAPGEDGKPKGKQKLHTFKQPDGEPLDVLGFGLMDHILENDCKEGQLVRVTYKGKVGGYHKCNVEVDDGESEDDGI